jgi:hypothetical protein
MSLSEDQLFLLMQSQMSHVHRMTDDLHLSDDGCDYLEGALRLAADLLGVWVNDALDKARQILTEDYLLEHYACDGICTTVFDYAKRTAPSVEANSHEKS